MRNILMAWLNACRPRTLPLACICILVGSSLALATGAFSWPVLLLSLLTAILLQVLSNLANDYGDGLRGVDNSQRLGPVRALQSGALSATQLRLSLFATATLALLCGAALLAVARLDATGLLAFMLLGLLAVVAAITYTLGNKPYGYAGLGDLSVWLFFGCTGVLGCYYLHGAQLQAALLLPASACGLLAVAVLNVNNMRDIDNDQSFGKRTLAVRLGLPAAKLYHQLLLTVALLLFVLYLLLHSTNRQWPLLLFVLAAVPVYRHLRAIRQAATPAQMARLLPGVIGCNAAVNGLFVATLLFVSNHSGV